MSDVEGVGADVTALRSMAGVLLRGSSELTEVASHVALGTSAVTRTPSSSGHVVSRVSRWGGVQVDEVGAAAQRCLLIAQQCTDYADAVRDARLILDEIDIATWEIGLVSGVMSLGLAAPELMGAAVATRAAAITAIREGVAVVVRNCVRALIARGLTATAVGMVEGLVTQGTPALAGAWTHGATVGIITDHVASVAAPGTDPGGRWWTRGADEVIATAPWALPLSSGLGLALGPITPWARGLSRDITQAHRREALLLARVPRWAEIGALALDSAEMRFPTRGSRRVDAPWAAPHHSIVAIAKPTVERISRYPILPSEVPTNPRYLQQAGTGFLIDPYTVVTAAHVLRPSLRPDAPDLRAMRIIVPGVSSLPPADDAWNAFRGAATIDFGPNDISVHPQYWTSDARNDGNQQFTRDLALIHLPSPVSTEGRGFFTVGDGKAIQLQTGDDIAVSGYPGMYNDGALNYPPEQVLRQYKSEGKIHAIRLHGMPWLETNIPIWKGHSGSPAWPLTNDNDLSRPLIWGIMTRGQAPPNPESSWLYANILPVTSQDIARLRERSDW
jgi:hypothetical protein